MFCDLVPKLSLGTRGREALLRRTIPADVMSKGRFAACEAELREQPVPKPSLGTSVLLCYFTTFARMSLSRMILISFLFTSMSLPA